jgi:hypothetical protein
MFCANKELHHVLLVPTILSIALVVLVSWKLMYQHLLHYHTHNALNSFTTVHWPPHQFLIKGSVKGSDWPPHQQKDRPPHQPSNPIQPSLASAWFARPKEVFSEGLADQHKQLLMKQAADKVPDRVQIHSIHHLIAIGSVARQLGRSTFICFYHQRNHSLILNHVIGCTICPNLAPQGIHTGT